MLGSIDGSSDGSSDGSNESNGAMLRRDEVCSAGVLEGLALAISLSVGS